MKTFVIQSTLGRGERAAINIPFALRDQVKALKRPDEVLWQTYARIVAAGIRAESETQNDQPQTA